MEDHSIHNLIEGYLNGSLSQQEQDELEDWKSSSIENQLLFEKLTDPSFISNEVQQLYEYNEEQSWKKVLNHMQNDQGAASESLDKFGWFDHFNWRTWTAVACVAGLIFAGIITFFKVPANNPNNVAVVDRQNDIAAPIHSKAVIQLANGQTVPLDSINEGMLAMQGNIAVRKNSQGQIIYSGKESQTLFNTIINPRGSKLVSLVLQDGTRVWLNSQSSIRYPVSFSGKNRNVEITGEAYFEVTKDPDHPFIVKTNDLTTEVLGTHFNINSYDDEEGSSVTLLEGKVKVGSNILIPGQQASTIKNTKELLIRKVDVEQVMAWQSGLFMFEDDNLYSVMRQLSRWYDLEIEYAGTIKEEKYSGMISRDLSLMNVLKILKVAGVKYTLEGKIVKIQTNQ